MRGPLENKHKFVQKDAKVDVFDIIMSLIEQSCAELGEQGSASRVGQVSLVHMVAKGPIL